MPGGLFTVLLFFGGKGLKIPPATFPVPPKTPPMHPRACVWYTFLCIKRVHTVHKHAHPTQFSPLKHKIKMVQKVWKIRVFVDNCAKSKRYSWMISIGRIMRFPRDSTQRKGRNTPRKYAVKMLRKCSENAIEGGRKWGFGLRLERWKMQVIMRKNAQIKHLEAM